jgi:hypothetical protein
MSFPLQSQNATHPSKFCAMMLSKSMSEREREVVVCSKSCNERSEEMVML